MLVRSAVLLTFREPLQHLRLLSRSAGAGIRMSRDVDDTSPVSEVLSFAPNRDRVRTRERAPAALFQGHPLPEPVRCRHRRLRPSSSARSPHQPPCAARPQP